MKSLLLACTVAIVGSVAASALADDTTTATPGSYTMPLQTIYGRANRPLVFIAIRPPTAASQAGAAHESLRESLLQQSVPAAMKGK
jgi:hypothetical protein